VVYLVGLAYISSQLVGLYHYLRQAGYVIVIVCCLLVCFSVCLSVKNFAQKLLNGSQWANEQN